jgi:hypothetical protein
MGRFFRRGVTKIRFLPAVAATEVVDGETIVGSPTRAEITAGSDLSGDVADIAGWSLNNAAIATPNLADRFTPQIPGEDTVGDSSLTFYDRDDSETIRTALAKGTEGFVLIMPYGDVPTKRCAVYPVRSAGVNDEFSLGNDAARFVVGFAITDVPNQDAVIPAAV